MEQLMEQRSALVERGKEKRELEWRRGCVEQPPMTNWRDLLSSKTGWKSKLNEHFFRTSWSGFRELRKKVFQFPLRVLSFCFIFSLVIGTRAHSNSRVLPLTWKSLFHWCSRKACEFITQFQRISHPTWSNVLEVEPGLKIPLLQYGTSVFHFLCVRSSHAQKWSMGCGSQRGTIVPSSFWPQPYPLHWPKEQKRKGRRAESVSSQLSTCNTKKTFCTFQVLNDLKLINWNEILRH